MDDLKADRVKRPKGVLFITIFYLFTVPLGIFYYVGRAIGKLPTPENMVEYYSHTGIIDHISAVIGTSLTLAYAIYLFRLKKEALYILFGSIGFQVVTSVYHYIYLNKYLPKEGQNPLAYLFSAGVAVVLILYTHSLKKKGVLR